MSRKLRILLVSLLLGSAYTLWVRTSVASADCGAAVKHAATTFGLQEDDLTLVGIEFSPGLVGQSVQGQFRLADGAKLSVTIERSLPFTRWVLRSYDRSAGS